MVEQTKLTAATLLVVDDNEDNREVLARRLERAGFVVPRAASGAEALAVVERGGIDLVLLDIMMPGLSGIDVLQKLRERHSAARLPVVMVTARTESEEIVHALELRCQRLRHQTHRLPRGPRPSEGPPAHAGGGHAAGAEEAALRGPRGGDSSPAATARGAHRRRDLRLRLARHAHRARAARGHQDALAANVANEPDALARFRREGISGCRVTAPERRGASSTSVLFPRVLPTW